MDEAEAEVENRRTTKKANPKAQANAKAKARQGVLDKYLRVGMPEKGRYRDPATRHRR